MAQEVDDMEFLLPSELLTDDDLLTDFGGGFGNSGGFGADLSSPVESVNGSLETGSDEDDVVAELTRKLTRSCFRDSSFTYDCTAKGIKLSGSPQSTLYGFKPVSRGSPISDSRPCSPSEAKNALSWDVLYAAAEEVATMRLAEETAAFYSKERFTPVPKPDYAAVSQRKHDRSTCFYPFRPQTQTHLSYHQLQAVKIQQMKQNQLLMDMVMNNGVMGQEDMGYKLSDIMRDGRGDAAYGLSTLAWPTLQQSRQRTVSGMKTVFRGQTGSKKERVGTGVFMPRSYAPNLAETGKKPGFSSNQNLDSIDTKIQHRVTGNFTLNYDAYLKQKNDFPAAGQGRITRPQPCSNQEFRLPQDWTYY